MAAKMKCSIKPGAAFRQARSGSHLSAEWDVWRCGNLHEVLSLFKWVKFNLCASAAQRWHFNFKWQRRCITGDLRKRHGKLHHVLRCERSIYETETKTWWRTRSRYTIFFFSYCLGLLFFFERRTLGHFIVWWAGFKAYTLCVHFCLSCCPMETTLTIYRYF